MARILIAHDTIEGQPQAFWIIGQTRVRQTVIGLGDPDEREIDDMYGLLCEARRQGRVATLPLVEIEVPRGKPNLQLVEDYSTWFSNY